MSAKFPPLTKVVSNFCDPTMFITKLEEGSIPRSYCNLQLRVKVTTLQVLFLSKTGLCRGSRMQIIWGELLLLHRVPFLRPMQTRMCAAKLGWVRVISIPNMAKFLKVSPIWPHSLPATQVRTTTLTNRVIVLWLPVELIRGLVGSYNKNWRWHPIVIVSTVHTLHFWWWAMEEEEEGLEFRRHQISQTQPLKITYFLRQIEQ